MMNGGLWLYRSECMTMMGCAGGNGRLRVEIGVAMSQVSDRK